MTEVDFKKNVAKSKMKIVIVTLVFLIRSPLASSHTDNFQISSFCLVNKDWLTTFHRKSNDQFYKCFSYFNPIGFRFNPICFRCMHIA